jgi:DNA-binding CsgD family transcriptional regulator
LLTNGSALVLRNGVVRTRDPAQAEPFADFMRKSKADLSIYCMPNRDDHHLIVAARQLAASAVIGLTVYEAEEITEYHWADLSQAFGLTGSERDIAEALGSGLTAEGIADQFGISVKTVRTHIRHLYSKLDVSSREELFHKLAPFMMTD